ncbi:MAG: nucleotidyltransferase domain-containing protein [Anaerolineae bacterium]
MAAKGEETWPPVRIDGTELQATSGVHYEKLLALQHFVEMLLAGPARELIAKIVLFGSVASGDSEPDSDVDVLVFGTRDLEAIRDMCYDAWLIVPAPHSVEAIIVPFSQLLVPDSYFIYSTLRQGKEIYTMNRDELMRQAADNYYWLAHEYLSGAENNLEAGYPRTAIDSAYNAAELCAKAFLLLSEVERMPTRHGATIRLFSDLFLKTGQLPSHLGRWLNRALESRNKDATSTRLRYRR